MNQDQDIAVTTGKTKRIYAFDVIRGIFLVVILVNHVELYPNLFDLFTGRGRLLVSAAEGFFFMSGLLVGMVYRRRLVNGFKFVFSSMWTRALELYVGSIILTLLFTAGAIYLNHPTIKDGLYSVTNWPQIIKETALMRYGYGWADWLDRYAILMFLAPFGFYLISRGKWWLLMAASVVAWALPGQGFTNHWQLIFALGMVIGYYWYEITGWIKTWPHKRQKVAKNLLISTTAVTFSLSYASVYVLSLLNERFTSLSANWQQFVLQWNSINAYVWLYAQKWTVGPLRVILFLLWFAVLFMLVDRYINAINRYSRNILMLLGQNALFVYVAEAFIVFIFKLFINPGHPLFINFLVTAAALATLILVTKIYIKIPPRWRPEISFRRRPETKKA